VNKFSTDEASFNTKIILMTRPHFEYVSLWNSEFKEGPRTLEWDPIERDFLDETDV